MIRFIPIFTESSKILIGKYRYLQFNKQNEIVRLLNEKSDKMVMVRKIKKCEILIKLKISHHFDNCYSHSMVAGGLEEIS